MRAAQGRTQGPPGCYSGHLIFSLGLPITTPRRNCHARLAGKVLMSKIVTAPRTKVLPKTKRPPLHKVILLNDDYTPREFVVLVLKAVFRMSETQAYGVMLTAHRKGSCVIAVYTRDVAETKATEATELGRSKGYPLAFTTEPEE
jgi:ATP-dependent Clp protease adaptor protein ClpS